jgi:hypothetical protein
MTPPSRQSLPVRCHSRRCVTSFLAMCVLLLARPAQAVVFYETGDPNHNTTAPTGAYSGAGWQYEGFFGGFLGTMISPQLFITAQHIGVPSSSFVSTALFNGVADVTYTIDTAANGGTGYWDISGTDLRIFKINETFTTYAELYTLPIELGQTLVTTGRGGPRGDEVIVSAESKGWKTGGGDGIARWGANQVTAIYSTGVGDVLAAQFNAVNGVEESFLSAGDSGGGVFIKDGATWKLAGVNYAIEEDFDTNDIIGDNSHFAGAIFDKGGLYQGSDAGGWTLTPDLPVDIPEEFYVSRISSNVAAIDAVIQAVPEPGGALLVATGMLLLSVRRRSQAGGSRLVRCNFARSHRASMSVLDFGA